MTTHIHYPHFHIPAVVRRHIWLFASLLVVVLSGVVGGIWLAQRSIPATEAAATIDWVPEYEADSPLVLFNPAVESGYLGGDANLDPDVAVWMQSEYVADTPLVIVETPEAVRWVGGDANLDPDVAVWMQSEYVADTPLVIVETPEAVRWVGGDANLDPDE